MQVIIGSFEGGYESRISYALDTVLDEIVDGYNDEHDTDFSSDDFNFDINMKGYLLACAENFVGEITADSNINPKNIKVHSPRQYNFETDTIEFSLTERECNFMRVQVLRKSKYIAEWKRICDNRFKKHSGYVPFYSAPDLDTDCKYWNEHQLGALFDCYFFEEIDNNDDSDDYWSAIVEDAFNFIEYEEPIAESRSRKHLRRLSLTESDKIVFHSYDELKEYCDDPKNPLDRVVPGKEINDDLDESISYPSYKDGLDYLSPLRQTRGRRLRFKLKEKEMLEGKLENFDEKFVYLGKTRCLPDDYWIDGMGVPWKNIISMEFIKETGRRIF